MRQHFEIAAAGYLPRRSCHPTNSMKTLKEAYIEQIDIYKLQNYKHKIITPVVMLKKCHYNYCKTVHQKTCNTLLC